MTDRPKFSWSDYGGGNETTCSNCGSQFNRLVLSERYGQPVAVRTCRHCGNSWAANPPREKETAEKAESE